MFGCEREKERESTGHGIAIGVTWSLGTTDGRTGYAMGLEWQWKWVRDGRSLIVAHRADAPAHSAFGYFTTS
jgi:hypothetical protein